MRKSVSVGITVRRAGREDAQQMLRLYNSCTSEFVGSASRTLKVFSRMLRRSDNVVSIAVDKQKRVVGYVYTRLEKRLNRGEFREILVDPEHKVEPVARLMVDKAVADLTERKVSSIEASSLRNPLYEKLFPELGFFESESNDVFMYAVIDVSKFLEEVSPVFLGRLKRFGGWRGVAALECEGHSVFFEKSGADVRRLVWTNQSVKLTMVLTRELLIKLLFGVADPLKLRRTGQLKIETAETTAKANRLLRALFPEKQFLIMDHW